jgi:hypothetical protein
MRTFPRMRSLAVVLLGLAATMPAEAQQRVGVNAAVNVDANGLPPGGAVRRLVIGQEVVHNERITTDAKGQTQILFLDGSSVSVGPNADLVIDEFVYDPATGTGKMTLTVVQGAFRFVGGKLSKEDNAVSVHLGTSTIGVRGGVFVADVQPGGKTEVVFVYGKNLTISGQSGCSQQLYRSGFAVDIATPGGCPDSPHQAPPGSTAAILSQLDGSQGQSGGATTVPTNAMVANSALPNTISNNVTLSVQQANAVAPFVATPPTPTVTPPQVPQNQIQISSSQSQPFVASPPTPSSPTPTPTPPTPTPPTPTPPTPTPPTPTPPTPTPPTPTPPTPTPPTPTPPAPQPVVVQVVGAFKDAFITNTGFTAATTKSPFAGTITYPAATPLQNGTLAATVNGGTFSFTVSPLTAGQTTNASAPSNIGTFTSGPATLTADGDFFFANTVAQTGDYVFFFGGVPVSPAFYAPTSATRILAFHLQPDYALANGSQTQTIPFLPSFAGGTTTNATVSPFYIVAPANYPFGAYNATNNPDVISPRWLQASLAINGQGANQSSVIAISTGVFATTDAGNVYGTGVYRGSLLTGGSGAQPTRLNSAVSTVPDGTGNALYGGTTLDGFVLDQNSFNGSGQLLQNAAVTPFGQTSTSYGFNQPALATAVPSGVGASRTTQSLSGYFGGIMFPSTTSPYALDGTTAIATDAASNRLSATFSGSDPFTATTSGITSAILQFGGLTSTADGSRSAFLDNNTFAATDSQSVPSQINGQNLPVETTGQPGTRIAMVTSSVVPGAANSLLPAGVSFCQCQYLQWGYWTGELDQTNSGGTLTRYDRANINTWVAGIPTVTMPTAGTGTYSGATIGSVINNGASYLAAGGFTNTYNFGNNTGTIAINNFDGRNFGGAVAGSGNVYAGNLSGSNVSGAASGQFYGPNAAETGGGFGVHATTGPSYIASGIFAGKLTGPIH